MPGNQTSSLHCDVLIAGGGVGGVAAALSLGRLGRRVILTEATDWIGGQLTSQAVPPDEHGWIEQFGCTATYREFRNAVRDTYRRYYPLKPEYRDQPNLNPGNGWVSPLCHEPRVALAVLSSMLAPHLSAGRLMILTRSTVESVEREGADRLAAATVSNHETGSSQRIAFSYLLDATENGDLLPLTDTLYVTGSESRRNTGEPSASDTASPDNVQSFSMCFVVEHREGEDHTIPRPESYGTWSAYRPDLDPPWPGKLLSWQAPNPRTMETTDYRFEPHREKPGFLGGLWSFRRLIDRDQFLPGAYASDLCLINWPMIDYLEGDLLTCDASTRKQRLEASRQLSLSMLYWLQTEAPHPNDRNRRGWPGLRPCPYITGGAHGLAQAPYIRESRRIVALYTIVEQDVSARHRPGENLAESYGDSVGIGSYRIDLHPSSGGDNYVDVPSLPFRIPLRALVPQTMENLLPAAKNIGTTHITNGCYRLHPVEWNIGEAAGHLVAFCLEHRIPPQRVARERDLLDRFQEMLRQSGVELSWPENLTLEDGDPHAHAR